MRPIMLKHLLIVIFVLQGFAFNAMASTNMSQFNQAEITKMQIMHQTVDNQANVTHTGCLSEQSQITNNCCSNGEGSCHNLVCNSIHATNLFDTKQPHIFQSGTQVSDTIPPFSVSVPVISLPPETPPPLV